MLLLHIICVQNQQSTDYQPVLRNRLFVIECKIKSLLVQQLYGFVSRTFNRNI